jgi:hypothetical protein
MARKKVTKQESPIMVWDVKQVRVRDLIPNELNPRTITADRLERLQDKISRLGFNQPVKLDHDGTLLGGNKRYRSLMEKGYGDLLIPAMVPPRALTEKERQEIIISDNVHEGAWDFDMLADHFELEDLKAWGIEDLPEITEVPLPNLDSKDPDCQQVTFVLSNEQKDLLDEAIKKASSEEDCEDQINQNKNGNTLAAIVRAYLRG